MPLFRPTSANGFKPRLAARPAPPRPFFSPSLHITNQQIRPDRSPPSLVQLTLHKIYNTCTIFIRPYPCFNKKGSSEWLPGAARTRLSPTTTHLPTAQSALIWHSGLFKPVSLACSRPVAQFAFARKNLCRIELRASCVQPTRCLEVPKTRSFHERTIRYAASYMKSRDWV